MIQEHSSYIDWFRSSTAYINAHRGKTFVVLLTGESLLDENFANIVYDLSLLRSLGVKLVLVHGARPQISQTLEKLGITSQYHQNLRITDATSLDPIIDTVGGLSISIEARFSMGLAESPMQGADIRLCRGNFVTARPVGVHDGIDFQYTGRVRKIATASISEQLNRNNMVLLSNLGYSSTGEVFNLAAEEVATEAAIALGADKLILFIPGCGVLNEQNELIASLSQADADRYISKHAHSKDPDTLATSHALAAAVKAFVGKVHRSHLISYKENGALLQELFTRDGNGSLLSADNFEQLREAGIHDVAGILQLIKPMELSGSLVARSRELLESEISNFKVIELENSIVACAALYGLDEQSGEVACIAIHPDYQKRGFGERLLVDLEAKARSIGLNRLFVLTTVAAHWFLEKGFSKSGLSDLPEQKQQLYNFQRNSKVFVKLLK